jgi:hypothetical protein
MVQSSERGGTRFYYMLGAILVMVMFGSLSSVSEKIGAASIPIWFAALGAVAVVLRGPVGTALGKRIAGDVSPAELSPEVHETVFGELDDLRVRVGELEERLDFSERLIAQRSQQEEGK